MAPATCCPPGRRHRRCPAAYERVLGSGPYQRTRPGELAGSSRKVGDPETAPARALEPSRRRFFFFAYPAREGSLRPSSRRCTRAACVEPAADRRCSRPSGCRPRPLLLIIALADFYADAPAGRISEASSREVTTCSLARAVPAAACRAGRRPPSAARHRARTLGRDEESYHTLVRCRPHEPRPTCSSALALRENVQSRRGAGRGGRASTFRRSPRPTTPRAKSHRGRPGLYHAAVAEKKVPRSGPRKPGALWPALSSSSPRQLHNYNPRPCKPCPIKSR